MKLEKLTPGDVVFSAPYKVRMGNTTMRRTVADRITVREVDLAGQRVLGYRNGRERWFRRSEWSKWRYRAPKGAST